MIRAALPLVLACVSCAAQRTPAWEPPPLPFGAVGSVVLDRMVSDGDAAFAARDDAAKLDDAIALWRAAIRFQPHDPSLYAKVSLASRLRAGSLDGSDDKKAREHSANAVAFAERGLCAQNSRLCQRARDGKPPAEIFALAERPEVQLLSAYSEALWAFAARAGLPTVLMEAARLRAATLRGVEIQRGAERAAAEHVLGALEASLPLDAGGDLRAAELHFEAALAAAPGYLPTRVDYAERLLARRRDRAQYRRMLEEVLAADANALPDAGPENRVAQRRARVLLEEAKK